MLTLGAGGWAAAAAPVPIERDFIVRSWTTRDGLPDDRVLSLLVDRKGFVWAGTRKGIARFDGRHFRTWSRSTHDVFVSEVCNALAEHPDGTVWVGTSDGLIHPGRPPVRHNLASYPSVLAFAPNLHRKVIRDVLVTGTGEVLVATEGGLAHQPWQLLDSDQALPDGLWTSLEASADGTIWAGTCNQLYQRRIPDGTWTREFPDNANTSTHFVHALAATSEGRVFAIIGSWQHQTGRLFQRDDSAWRPVFERPLNNSSQPLFLAADQRGGLWFPVTFHEPMGFRDL